MTTLLERIIKTINKYRRMFRGEEPESLVRVIDDNVQSTEINRSDEAKAHFPDSSQPQSDDTAIRTRSTPDPVDAYSPVTNEGLDSSIDPDIDLSRDDQFEAYASDMQIPQKTLEKWIAAGILCPDEIRAAEKLLKMIREKAKQRPNL
jgi:hypothetical protein